MKTLLTVLIVFCAMTTQAQEWRKYHRNDLELNYTLIVQDYGTGGRHFRINPYDNSLWMTTTTTIQTLNILDGSSKYFRPDNTPVLQTPTQLTTFEFIGEKVFIMDRGQGVYLYENETLSSMYSTSGLYNGITTDENRLYLTRENQPIVKWENGSFQYLFNSYYIHRIVVKNDFFWLTYDFGGASLYLYDMSGNIVNYDNSLRMDNGNYDHKFSPYKDTLYVAGNKGLSLLHNLAFFDSIAPDNTTNMPPGVILDFEFDADDNIWALFGSDAQTPTSIAHYNQVAKNWDAYYDATNANLNFDTYCSIELDNLGNVWMVNYNYIHVLELNTLPAWLSVKQPKLEAMISVYPNPAKETVSIETEALLSEMYLTDQLGKRTRTFNPAEKQFSVAELPSGMYFVEFVTEKGEKSTVKLVKE
ncbi:T9SS type A sorting domain-containing protein [Fluviicola sp. SGL-29]|nr:T9SS type A sorting domain-containing protein [Fluviicola sp. SGL-29]